MGSALEYLISSITSISYFYEASFLPGLPMSDERLTVLTTLTTTHDPHEHTEILTYALIGA